MEVPLSTTTPADGTEIATARSTAAAREQFLELVQGLDAIVWEMDAATWRFTFVSDPAERILGYPLQRWYDEPTFWQDVILHPEDRQWAIDYCLTATNEGRDHEFLYRAQAADGRVVWLKDLVRVVTDEQGRPRWMRGVMVDITKEKQAESGRVALLEMVERITDAFFGLDRAWRFTYVNRRAEPLLQRRPEELIGRSIWEMFPEAVGSTFWEQYHRAMRENVTVQFEEFYPPLDRWFEVRAYPSPDGLSVFFRDVTEQRLTAERSRLSEQRYRLLVGITAAIVWTTPRSGEIESEQPSWGAFTGQRWEEYRGAGWLDAVHPDDRAATLAVWRQAVETRTQYELEHRLRRHDGVYRRMLVRATPLLDDAGEIHEWVGIHQDISELRAAEAALHAERERLHQIFMQAPAAIAVVEGADHVFSVVNPRYLELVGNRDVLGKSVREALPEVVEQGFIGLLDQVRATGKPFVAHEALVRLDRKGDGTLEDTFVDFVYQPLLGADGAVFGVMAHAVDITEQVLARRRVTSLATERSAILAQIADGVIATDADGHYTMVNTAAQVMLGTDQMGQQVGDSGRPFQLLRLDGTPLMGDDAPLGRALRGETVVNAEWRIRRANGSEVEVMGSAAPVYASEGELIGTVLTFRDVTERRQLTAQLEHERQRLQSVFLEAPALIALYRGPEHEIVMVNPVWEQLAGRTREQVLGRRFADVFPEMVPQGIVDLLHGVYESGQPFTASEMLVTFERHGAMADTYWNFVFQPIMDEDGRTHDILVHAVEVTDQVRSRQEVERKAEELVRLTTALERSNRELDQFAYVTSHDLKAPLRGIANLAQWIEEDVADRLSEESREHMRLLQGRVHRMEALIDGILTYSRAARSRTHAEPVDSGAMVRDILDLLAPGPEVEVEIAPAMPSLLAERVPLQQVFINLLSNALKHGRAEAPRLSVGWRDAGAAYEFSVSDNGPGIPPEYHDRIWGIFQTLEARDRVEGTGIGLAVVKKIVESRGGQAWVTSTPGQGATFSFTWPKAAPTSDA